MMKMKNKTQKAYAYGSTIRKPMMYGGTANQMSAQPLSPQQQNMTRKQREDMGMAAATNRPMMMAKGGKLKEPTNPGLKKLPKPVRNKMGYMAGGGKLMETRQEIKDRVSKKDPDLSKSQLSRAYNIARGMDPSGRLTDQDISRVVNVLRGMQKPR